MATFKSSKDVPAKKTIRWSMRESTPAADSAPVENPDPSEPQDAQDRWWRESSFDLRHGLEVVEKETIPGELLDDLVVPRRR
jgi:hypothetical protein